MANLGITRFKGLDVRRDPALADESTLVEATNVELTRGKTIKTRPGTSLVAELPEESVGLFKAGGALHSVLPAGYADLFGVPPAGFVFDYVGDGTRYDRDSLLALEGAETFGSSAIAALPYIAVRRQVGAIEVIEHHYVTVRPDPGDPNLPLDTKVLTSFKPDPGIIKLAQKIFAPSRATGGVHYSSTEFGPTNWVAPLDAGVIPVTQRISGDREIVALSYYENRLVVFFTDAVQIWAVDPSPDNFFLVASIQGPGAEGRAAVENVAGDVYYFAKGGVRSLRSSTITGQLRESDIGAPIFELTKELSGADAQMLWVPSRMQLFLAFADAVYVLTNSPVDKTFGWTKWTFPWTIAAMEESGGDVFFRTTDHKVYKLDTTRSDDQGFADVSWGFRTQFFNGPNPFSIKDWQMMRVVAQGTADVELLPDLNDPTIRLDGTRFDDRTTGYDRIPVMQTSEALGVALSGAGAFELSGLSLQFQALG